MPRFLSAVSARARSTRAWAKSASAACSDFDETTFSADSLRSRSTPAEACWNLASAAWYASRASTSSGVSGVGLRRAGTDSVMAMGDRRTISVTMPA